MGSCAITSIINTKSVAPSFLIVCFRYIGDVLVTTPLTVSIKQAYPDAQIDYLVFEGTQGVLVNNPHVRNVIALPRKSSNVRDLFSLFRSYDISFAAYPSDRTAMAAAITGKYSIGLTYGSNKEWWKGVILNATLFCDDNQHVVANILSLLSPLNIPPVPCVITGYDDDALAFARKTMPAGKYVVLHPYSRNGCKFWPATAWGELANLIVQRTNCLPVFTRTPEVADTDYLEQILASAPAGTLAFAESCSLSRLAAAIKESVAFVGIDTAVTHCAASVGTPTVVVLGSSLSRYWAPWPNGCTEISPFAANKGVQRVGNVTVVQKDWPCVPCNRETCSISTRGKMECLEELTAHEVFGELEKTLGMRK